MISMHGVPSSLILRNESWVRKQANAIARRVPSNVEKADLIQVGLIAVAQSALGFEWEGDRETEEARDAFVRYARMRVKGAMLDELRQMDHLGRAQRRNIKLIQVVRERWRASHGTEPTATEISTMCELKPDEIIQLEAVARAGQTTSLSQDEDSDDPMPLHEPATSREEVEARVDTSILMRRLEKFFATLPSRDRQVIDAYLGIGMTPVELAQSMAISPSRVSQLFRSICDRIGIHLGHDGHHRSTDRPAAVTTERLDQMIAEREAELARAEAHRPWTQLFEQALAPGAGSVNGEADDERLTVTSTTRWG